ncbi:(d)CMP kinase [Gudongella sp. DL1XJH-153]|uniref:(d)CMP kinase n=1 Tax=Gudongella sp. DL1XJH-153 TaxID=3409804 RepID=UPI003BB65260
MARHYSIAIDGPAGAGKSTVAKIVAKKLNFEYIDTGAMYRAYTLKVLQNNLDPKNQNEVKSLLDSTDIYFIDNHIYLDGEMVDDEIRDNRISDNVSYIASIKEVRSKMVSLQRKMAERKSVVMDGRDITTVVLPKADYKFYVTASVEERGNRRYLELINKGVKNITLQSVIDDIRRRDEIDSTREESPLTRTEDSVLIDTTELSIEETVDMIIDLVKGGE